jgi:hypothetical protein
MTTADWECSRCGSWHGNPSCYVCGAEDESDENEPDPDRERDDYEASAMMDEP